MLNQVQHDKQVGLLKAGRLIWETIRFFRDDKGKGWTLAVSLIAETIRFLPSVEMTKGEADGGPGDCYL
jgi:hypothetical protein